jgi:hypothetical protein
MMKRIKTERRSSSSLPHLPFMSLILLIGTMTLTTTCCGNLAKAPCWSSVVSLKLAVLGFEQQVPKYATHNESKISFVLGDHHSQNSNTIRGSNSDYLSRKIELKWCGPCSFSSKCISLRTWDEEETREEDLINCIDKLILSRVSVTKRLPSAWVRRTFETDEHGRVRSRVNLIGADGSRRIRRVISATPLYLLVPVFTSDAVSASCSDRLVDILEVRLSLRQTPSSPRSK